MKLFSKSIVEKTMLKLGTQTTQQMSLEAARFNKEQPLLASFLTAFTSELPTAAQDLTLYLAYLTWRIFEANTRVEHVSANIILSQIQENWLFIERFVQMTRNESGSYLSEIDFLSQPHILDYIATVILEEGKRNNIAEHHMGYMIFVLKTVLDSLDAAGSEKFQ
jgi:hypothetical protein